MLWSSGAADGVREAVARLSTGCRFGPLEVGLPPSQGLTESTAEPRYDFSAFLLSGPEAMILGFACSGEGCNPFPMAGWSRREDTSRTKRVRLSEKINANLKSSRESKTAGKLENFQKLEKSSLK